MNIIHWKNKTYLLFLILTILVPTPNFSDEKRKPAWFFVHTASGVSISGEKNLLMPIDRDIFGFTSHLYFRSHAYLNAVEFASLWAKDKSFYSFKTHPPWAVLSWPQGEDVLSKEFKIKALKVAADGRSINYLIEYDGSFPHLFSQNTYSLFIEAECEPEGLKEFFNKPDCDCTENCEKICRTACFLK
ncbi:hypothetical protein OA343_03080 [Paracoccaceae bacterium]|nr:hypothetical protein [Paracoccaceae bacterium]